MVAYCFVRMYALDLYAQSKFRLKIDDALGNEDARGCSCFKRCEEVRGKRCIVQLVDYLLSKQPIIPNSESS